MSQPRVTVRVDVLEKNGQDLKVGEDVVIEVHSHWNSWDRVVLYLPDGTRLTVNADEMREALSRARKFR